MLAWVKRDVESPYGAVSTLHWAVPSTSSSATTTTMPTEDDGQAARADDIHKTHVTEVVMTTEEQVTLESAEDQLGAVLWNSNSAALHYLHHHVFPAHPSLRGRLGPGAAASSDPAPLRGLRVIELGAGVGCLGIALAMAGARGAITDLKELLPLMAYNAALNARPVRRLSDGHGACEALAWKWGPSTATNPKKQLRKHAAEAAAAKGEAAARAQDAEVVVARSMVTALAAPSEPWLACSAFLLGASPSTSPSAPVAKVDYVVMCDALYGNPQAWPQLLYTLTEILAANPDGCEVVNFCEQRVEDVEGAFLDRLAAENERTLRLWREGVDAVATTTTATMAPRSSLKRGRDGEEAVRAGAAGALTLTKAQAHALLESSNAMMELAMWEKQRALLDHANSTPYIWHYMREKVTESVSDLQMPILVTRIRWVRAAAAAAETEGKQTRSSKKPKRE